MGRSYTEILDARFRGLLARWLSKLPPEGWEGTPGELSDALNAEATVGEKAGLHVVPKVRYAAETLRRAGFTLEETRTATERRVTIRRSAPPSAPAIPWQTGQTGHP
jgi:hypothetical protein